MPAHTGAVDPSAIRLGKHPARRHRQHARLRDLVHWRLYGILASVIATVAIGTIGFTAIEGRSTIDAMHLTIQTLTTVGYGDVPLKTDEGKIFSDGLGVAGVVIVTIGLGLIVQGFVSGGLRETLRKLDYHDRIERLEDHVIVCGYGQVGSAVVDYLLNERLPVVVLDRDEGALANLPLEVPRVCGDANSDDVALAAGVERASCLIATTSDDSDNLLMVATAKLLNPKLIAMARSGEPEDLQKMQRIGADLVISPELEGGQQMAQVLAEAPSGVIVCGHGLTGHSVMAALVAAGRSVCVIDLDATCAERLLAGVTFVHGDATKEHVLMEAGLKNATGVVVTMDNDAANLMTMVSVKDLRPSVTVVVRAAHPDNIKKMLALGADVVISPEGAGGIALARAAAQVIEAQRQGQ